jgi:argininosuccinate lyase
LYANTSRGKFEAMLFWTVVITSLPDAEQACTGFDSLPLPEFGYFPLPKQLCTGSSIMPQKKNPDGLELARSRSALVSSCAMRVKSIIRSLPSGYNRDFQDTKGPLLEGTKATWQLVQIFLRMIDGLEVHPEALVQGCTADLYATDVVLKQVLEGKNFRDTYKEVGLHLEDLTTLDPYQALEERTSLGTTGNLGLDEDQLFISLMRNGCEEVLQSFFDAYYNLCGIENVQTVLF